MRKPPVENDCMKCNRVKLHFKLMAFKRRYTSLLLFGNFIGYIPFDSIYISSTFGNNFTIEKIAEKGTVN